VVWFTARPVSCFASRTVACRLDSKARVVLPLVLREKLCASKGDVVLFQINFSGAAATVRVCKADDVSALKRSSKNGWEK